MVTTATSYYYPVEFSPTIKGWPVLSSHSSSTPPYNYRPYPVTHPPLSHVLLCRINPSLHYQWLACPFTVLIFQLSLYPVSCCNSLLVMSSYTASIYRFTDLSLFLPPSLFCSNTSSPLPLLTTNLNHLILFFLKFSLNH